MMGEPTADETALLAEMKRSWSENLRFYSNAGKKERERWVVAEFLARLPVPFEPNELRSRVQKSKVDVEFRDARFQVKEIPDPNFRRGDEIKTTYHRVMNAKTLQDTVGPGFVYDVPRVESAYDLVRDTARELACSATYKDHKATLDLLCYVTRTRASVISVKEVKPEELSPLGWRSISCLIGNQAMALYMGPGAPMFLQPLR
jgi:Putative endonuclease, protein of unknown function (DUF1780)